MSVGSRTIIKKSENFISTWISSLSLFSFLLWSSDCCWFILQFTFLIAFFLLTCFVLSPKILAIVALSQRSAAAQQQLSFFTFYPYSGLLFRCVMWCWSEGAKNDLCKSHFLLLIIINDFFMMGSALRAPSGAPLSLLCARSLQTWDGK